MFSSQSRTILILLIILLTITCIEIVTRTVSLVGLAAWIAAVCFFGITRWVRSSKEPLFPLTKKDIGFMVLICAVLLSIYSFINQLPNHFHRDEFILAYTSYSLPPVGQIDWFKGYPDDWGAQFSILFFILQKPFFILFGPTVTAMRISVYPYSVFIIFYLYALAKMISSRRFAILTTIAYSTLACNTYFATLALHNICSACFLLAGVYHFIGICRGKNMNHAVLLGVFLALSCLTYTSSYIILPIVGICGWIHWRMTKSSAFGKHMMVAACVFLVIMFPFFIHAFFVRNYFLDRFMQVNIFGSQSNVSTQLKNGTSVVSFLTSNVIRPLLGLFQPGYGGAGGYYFGFRALFDPFTSVFMIFGVWSLCVHSLIKKHIHALVIGVTVLLASLVGYFFTIQPPAFHRLSVIFPFFAIILAYGIYRLAEYATLDYPTMRRPIILISCVVFIAANSINLRDMITNDIQDYPYSVTLAQKIQSVVPKHATIAIGAYKEFYIGKEIFLRTKAHYHFVTNYKTAVLSNYTGGPLLLANPSDEEIRTLKSEYPLHSVIRYDNPIGESMAFFYPTPTKQISQ